MQALTAWASCVRDHYQVYPVFTHVDKDMAEIGMLRQVWSAKVQLCWWHLRKAVRERLGKSKLTTSPYNVQRARQEYTFIDPTFIPSGNADVNKYEGGIADTSNGISMHPNPNALWLRIPMSAVAQDPGHPILGDCLNTYVGSNQTKLVIKLPARNMTTDGTYISIHIVLELMGNN
jgi:hypothetical protein